MSKLDVLPRAHADATGPEASAAASSDAARRHIVDGDDEHSDTRDVDAASASGQPDAGKFPRSHLLRTIQRHPVATAAIVAGIVFVGPRTIGRWGLRGIAAANRHATAMAPLLGQLARVSRRR